MLHLCTYLNMRNKDTMALEHRSAPPIHCRQQLDLFFLGQFFDELHRDVLPRHCVGVQNVELDKCKNI